MAECLITCSRTSHVLLVLNPAANIVFTKPNIKETSKFLFFFFFFWFLEPKLHLSIRKSPVQHFIQSHICSIPSFTVKKYGKEVLLLSSFLVRETCFLNLSACVCVCCLCICLCVCVCAHVISSLPLQHSTGSPARREACAQERVSSRVWPRCCSASPD